MEDTVKLQVVGHAIGLFSFAVWPTTWAHIPISFPQTASSHVGQQGVSPPSLWGLLGLGDLQKSCPAYSQTVVSCVIPRQEVIPPVKIRTTHSGHHAQDTQDGTSPRTRFK